MHLVWALYFLTLWVLPSLLRDLKSSSINIAEAIVATVMLSAMVIGLNGRLGNDGVIDKGSTDEEFVGGLTDEGFVGEG